MTWPPRGERAGARAGTAAALRAGDRRVAYVGAGGPGLAGFLDAHAALGRGVDEDLVVLGPSTAAAADAACRGLLSSTDPPQAIVVDVPAAADAVRRGVLAAVAPGIVPDAMAGAGSLPG